MKKLSLIKKLVMFSAPVGVFLVTTPVVLSSCVFSTDPPHWLTSNLPSGMTVEDNTATITLTSEPFWETGLTSSSTIDDITNSLSNVTSGLIKLVLNYFSISYGWFLDTSKGTYGIVLDAQPENSTYGVTIYFKSLFSDATGSARLVVQGLNLGL